MNLKDRAENNLILRRLNLVSKVKAEQDVRGYYSLLFVRVYAGCFFIYFFNRTDKQIYMSSLIRGLIDRRTFICVS